VGQNGEPIKTTVLQDVIAGLKKVNKFFSYRGKLKIGEPLKPNKGMKDKEASTGEETVSLLGDIKGLFQDYFTEKKVKGDTDGDGDREGSWEDIKARREADKAKREAGKPTDGKSKDTEKKGGLMGLLAGALDAITGFLGGFKSLLKAGGVLSGLGKLLGVGRVAGTVAAAAGGMGTLGTIGAGIAAVVSSPVTLGIVGTAIVGYGAYKGYKALRRWMSKPSTLDTIRYTQYGFKKDNTTFFNKIVDLEEYMKEFVKIGSEQATIDEKKMDIEEMMSIFGMSSKDNDHKRIYGTWYMKRFKPVYLTHVSALNIINGSVELSKVNELKKEEKLKYIEATKFSSGPYTVTTLPVLDGSVTAATAADVGAAIEAALKEFATQPGGAKSNGTGLPTDVKKPEDLKSDGRLDYGKSDAARKLPGASVSGSSAIDAAFASNAVSAFDTVRFKTYGLKELDKGKVVSLIMLETHIAKKIMYQGTKASFDGNPNEILEKVTTYFGIPDLFSDQAVAWTKWFRDRFLPVYLNYATLHMQTVNKAPKSDSAPVLDANQQYDIALALSATSSAWRVSDTPWDKYELNMNPDTVKANLEFLKDAVKQKTLREEKAKEDTAKQPSNAPPVKSADVSAFNASKPEYNPSSAGTVSATSTAPVWDRNGPGMSGGMGTGPTTEGLNGVKPDPTAKIVDPTGSGISGLRDTIVSAAKVVGIDPSIMLTTAAIESDFNPRAKAKTSSASGLMQFLDDTWSETVQKHGKKYGYDGNADRFDPKASAIMGAHYIKDSLADLSKVYKGPLGSVEAYLVHFMGAAGAKRFLKAMQENPGQYGSQLMPKQAASNPDIYFGRNGPLTLGEMYQLFYNKIRTKAARYGISLPASSGADTSEKSKYVMPGAGQNTGVVSEVNKPNGNAVPITQEAPKSSYNPTARPAAMQQQAVQASRQASTPLSDAVGFNPKAMGSGTETMNANKNTLTADIMKNTESILSQSLDVQKETLDVMKMIYEKINNIKAPEVAPKSDAKQYEAPKAPVPMRKSA
jgi:soluble lytic murein transglycosylase-like protein